VQRRGGAGVTVGHLVGAVFALGGFLLGTRSLGDNSFLTHLATGRLILDTGSVPSVDPYSFTAPGEPWVVQSWLASLIYAGVEELAGAGGIRLLVGALFAGVVWVTWLLARPAVSLLPRAGLTALVLVVGGNLWSERPLMFALVLFGVAVLVVERGWSPWVLLPAGWFWANTHGSFPLALLALALLAAGARLDGRPATHELRCLATLAGGCALGAIGPLGLQALVFPLELVSRQEVLQEVVEWQAPTFTSLSERAFILQVVLAVVAVIRSRSWRHGLVLAVFVPLALLGARNIAVASILLVPGTAGGLPPVGRLVASQPLREPVGRLAAGLLALALPLVAVVRLDQPDYRLPPGTYPMPALRWLESEGIDPLEVRTAVPDSTGNLLTLLGGPSRGVFFDDRFDMYPPDVFADHLSLARGDARWRHVLDRWEIDLVLMPHQSPLAQLALADPSWRSLHVEAGWFVGCRRDADLGSRTC
jgi:hypothetical protein